MFDHLLDRDNYNKWSNLGFGEEIGIIEIQICTLSGALCWRHCLTKTLLHYDLYNHFMCSSIVEKK